MDSKQFVSYSKAWLRDLNTDRFLNKYRRKRKAFEQFACLMIEGIEIVKMHYLSDDEFWERHSHALTVGEVIVDVLPVDEAHKLREVAKYLKLR